MSRKYTVLVVIFCVCLIAANLFETKIFRAGPLTLTGGFLIFPISYIINDCLSEVYGFNKARFAIFLAFALNLGFVLTAQMVKILPEVEYGTAQEHLDYLFNADLRITAASMLAFLAGSLLNARVLVKMKEKSGKRFGVRAIVSTVVGESVDSLVFFPIAFMGVGLRNMVTLMVTQIILKTLYEIIVLPITSRVVRSLKESGEA